MRRTLLAVALLFGLCAVALAQGDAARPAPTPFDVVGEKIYETTWLAVLDNFAIEIQNRPTAKAFVVAYGVPNDMPGWPLRRANWARGYLTTRGIDPSRIAVVFGGYRDAIRYEQWIIDAGERLPVEPFDFTSALTREKGAYKFDQFTLYDPRQDYWYDGSYGGYLDARGRYEPLALALRQDTAARGVLIAYSNRTDRRGTDRRLAAQMKRSALTAQSIAPDRIVAMAGGRREHRYAEIWIVPPGAEMPKPTPDARAPRRRRR